MSATGLSAGRDISFTQISHFAASPATTERLPVFEVPLANRRWFWGREELFEELELAWRSQNTAAPVLTLAGMGGVGKSQLAAQFAYRHRAELVVVWWVSCTSVPGDALDATALARDGLGALGAFLGLAVGDDVDVRAVAVRRWLETTERPWLVVFDDVPEWSVVEGLVPQEGSGLCLITSRNPHWDLADAVINIGVFEPDVAAAYLQARAGIEDADGALALAQALGGLVLALEQAGAFLRRSPVSLSFGDYLHTLHQRGLRVFTGGRVDDYQHVVTTVWEQSFEAVARRNPLAGELLELFGVLAPAPLPTGVLTAGGVENFDVVAALEHLAAYSLISSGSENVVVHQLVQRALADRMGPQQISVARKTATQLLASAFPSTHADPTTWPAASALIPHVLSLYSAQTDDDVLLRLASGAAAYLWAQGDYGAARRLQEQVLAARRELLGERHRDSLLTANNLAATLRSQGELEAACRLQEQVVSARREMLGERHPDTLSLSSNLATVLWDLDEWERARRLQEDVLAVQREVLGERHPQTLVSAHNLAGMLGYLNEPERARELQEKVLAAYRELLGECHPHTLIAANNFAETLRGQGELERARRLQEDVLAVQREVLGERHPDTLLTAHNLAGSLRDQGELEGARQLQEKVLAGYREVLGERHLHTLISARKLAETLRDQGELEGARQLQEKVLAGCRETLGERHDHTLLSAVYLARTLRALGELEAVSRLEEEFGFRLPSGGPPSG